MGVSPYRGGVRGRIIISAHISPFPGEQSQLSSENNQIHMQPSVLS